jgi:hypothetical protein
MLWRFAHAPGIRDDVPQAVHAAHAAGNLLDGSVM